ncbi:hypothetical protein CK203_062418 [Vitis vinifera]|uniref:Protein ENHANCED DISEASE RESISTANCE 2 C-terminal domain-containing protein n=1 Tax=Vitis vinifera TaxID=29760 RepID=A0A438FQ02_VITVI|nr:hypothetical protein CK203_062418 [Vitis vinifera]
MVRWKTGAEVMQLSGILLQIKVEYLLNHFYQRGLRLVICNLDPFWKFQGSSCAQEVSFLYENFSDVVVFVSQGNAEDELPERLIGAVRVSRVDFSSAIVPKLDPYTYA